MKHLLKMGDLTPEELAALQESAASVKKGLENLPE